MLDSNPSYMALCQNIEARGVTVDRAGLAKKLLGTVSGINFQARLSMTRTQNGSPTNISSGTTSPPTPRRRTSTSRTLVPTSFAGQAAWLAATTSCKAHTWGQTPSKPMRTFGFLDLPAEIRGIIYHYLFQCTSLWITDGRIVLKKSHSHTRFMRTSRFIAREATPYLFSLAKQVLDNEWYDSEDYEGCATLDMRPIHHRQVPYLQVHSYGPLDLSLNVKRLGTYTNLRTLLLGDFGTIDADTAPHSVIASGQNVEELAKTPRDIKMNNANDTFLVAQVKEALLDEDRYVEMIGKPMQFRHLKRMLFCAERRYKVLLGCDICMEDPDYLDFDPVRADLVIDWDNSSVHEKYFNGPAL